MSFWDTVGKAASSAKAGLDHFHECVEKAESMSDDELKRTLKKFSTSAMMERAVKAELGKRGSF